jgi:hypothetical protein
MCDVIGPLQPPHFSALPLLACPRDARPHEPLCCVAVPQVTSVRLASALLLRAAIIDDTHAACLQTPPQHTNAVAASYCALLPLPARKPSYCLDGSTPGIDRVAAPIRPSPSPSRAGPRKRDRGHLPDPIGATSTSRAPTHNSSTADSTQHHRTTSSSHHRSLPSSRLRRPHHTHCAVVVGVSPRPSSLIACHCFALRACSQLLSLARCVHFTSPNEFTGSASGDWRSRYRYVYPSIARNPVAMSKPVKLDMCAHINHD